MDLNKFTSKAQEAVYQSQQTARDHHHQAIEPIHLLGALLSQPEGIVPALVTKIAGNTAGPQDLIRRLKARCHYRG